MKTAIIWFRRDLRLQDNPALQAALSQGFVPIPVYIHDETASFWPEGSASSWWLHHSLISLQKDLDARGSGLLIFNGHTEKQLIKIIKNTRSHQVFFNRKYEPGDINRDRNIATALQGINVQVNTCNASLLREPWESVKPDGKPYRVFTPFWNRMLHQGITSAPLHEINELPALPETVQKLDTCSIDSLRLLPGIPWDREFYTCWKPGEAGALESLKHLINTSLITYPEERDIPSLGSTSLLSPHLHFGEISPIRIWNTVQSAMVTPDQPGYIHSGEVYLRQLAWRDFAYQLMHHFPHTTDKPLDERFNRFPWRKNYKKDLQRWQSGMTGIPIIDAGMRELWATGFMHNRVRMLVASILTKNLLIPWQEGARWFWDTLVDADLANNTMGWQWTAGCGADAAPFFRIFNPVTQGERYDPDGSYVRKWVTELSSLPAKWIHRPWEIPASIRSETGFQPGVDYPLPIVDLAESRKQALQMWNVIKS